MSRKSQSEKGLDSNPDPAHSKNQKRKSKSPFLNNLTYKYKHTGTYTICHNINILYKYKINGYIDIFITIMIIMI